MIFKNIWQSVKNYQHIFIILSLLWQADLIAQPQNVEFTHLGIDKGLYQTSIYSIAQDKTGFTWIATQDGLLLYDGVNFIEFNHNSFDNKGLSNNSLSKVFVDSKNNVWAGTWGGGLNIYNRLARRFKVFKNDKANTKSLPHNRVQTIFEDRSGVIWIGTAGGGICKFNPGDSSFTRYPFGENKANALSHGRVWSITQAPDGNLWIATQKGLNILNPGTGAITKLPINAPEKFYENANFIRTVYANSKGQIWVGSQNGIYVFHNSNMPPKQIALPFSDPESYRVKTINCFFETVDHAMLIGTYGAGLYYYNPKNGSTQSYSHNTAENSSISANDIRCITADQSNLIWIGTRGGSINTTQLQPKRFTTFDNENRRDVHLIDKNIRSALFDSKGNLWTGTNEAGLHLMRNGQTYFTRIERKELDLKLYSDRILSIFEDFNNTVWFACDDGLYYSNNTNIKVTKYQFPQTAPFPARTESVRGLTVLANRYLWFASSGYGFLQYDLQAKTWKSFNTQNGFPSDDINYILPEMDKGILWLGTGNGLVKFNYTNQNYTILGNEPGKPLRNNHIWALYLNENILWIGTSEGLVRFSLLHNTFTVEQTGNDFANKVISGITVDERGMLWISTTRGITRYNPANNSSKSYNIDDGLDWNSYTPGVYTENTAGDVAFGGIHGLTVFNPDKITVNTYKSPVAITGLDVFNKTSVISLIPPGLPPEKNTRYILDYTQDNFRVSFATFNYHYPRKNRYFYQLIGVDEEWRDAGTASSATYSHLGPGEYIFRVKAFNNDMFDMGSDAVIIIEIKPPFYNALWFKLLIIASIIGAVSFMVFYRLNAMRKMQILLEDEVKKRTAALVASEKSLREVNAAKDKFFSIIAHDLRSPFQALISYSNIINTEFDSLEDQEKKEISGQIEEVAKSAYALLENLLKWSFTQTKRLQISIEKIQVADAVQQIISMNQQTAKMKNISISTDIPVDIFVNADKEMFATILRNLAGNAIKFTRGGGLVHIQAAAENNFAVIHIRDNGVGMNQEKIDTLFQLDKNNSTIGTNREKGTGLGLILCKEFAELQNGTLTVSSTEGEGTIFTVSLPLNNE